MPDHVLAQAVVQILADAPLLAVADFGDLFFHEFARADVGINHHAALNAALLVNQAGGR